MHSVPWVGDRRDMSDCRLGRGGELGAGRAEARFSREPGFCSPSPHIHGETAPGTWPNPGAELSLMGGKSARTM